MLQFWRAFTLGVVSTVGLIGLVLLAEASTGWLRWPVALAGFAVFIFCNSKWSDAAEHLAHAKGISHPMYGVLGPVGLVMVVFTSRPRQSG